MTVPKEVELEKLLTTKEVAELLGVPYRTILDWRPDQRPPAARIGKHLRFRPSDVDSWIENKMASGRS
jgi:excisionase family DNA binding protein